MNLIIQLTALDGSKCYVGTATIARVYKRSASDFNPDTFPGHMEALNNFKRTVKTPLSTIRTTDGDHFYVLEAPDTVMDIVYAAHRAVIKGHPNE